MTELVPAAPAVPALDQARRAVELAALPATLALLLEQDRPVTVVYAPTTVTHYAASGALVSAASGEPVPSAAARSEWAHPGIDVDVTGGGAFAVPVRLVALPEVAESRSFAPLVLWLSGWSGLGAGFFAALTRSPFAIGYVTLALVTSALAFAKVYRDQRGA